jgi:hypothetical protein
MPKPDPGGMLILPRAIRISPHSKMKVEIIDPKGVLKGKDR